MAQVTDKHFEAKTLVIDARDWINCTFSRCKLVYKGNKPPSFQNCNFWGNEFVFDGPAGNTLAFLQSISKSDSGLQSIFMQLFPTHY